MGTSDRCAQIAPEVHVVARHLAGCVLPTCLLEADLLPDGLSRTMLKYSHLQWVFIFLFRVFIPVPRAPLRFFAMMERRESFAP